MHKAALLLAAVAIALPAGANTITVNSMGYFAGDGGCSLTEAIKNANAGGAPQSECAAGAPGMDVIEFAPTLYVHPPGSAFVYNTAVTAPVTIAGPGVFLLTLSGIVLESGASGSLIEDVRLVGPVTSVGADLTLNRVRVTRSSTFGSGGGIAITNANLTVADSEISGNTAFDAFNVYPHFGGGILFDGDMAGTRTLTLTNVTLSGNYATTSGGALAVRTAAGVSAVMNLTHVTVAVNYAGTSGGGIYLEPGAGSITAYLKNVVFGDNIAPSGSAPDIYEAADTALTMSYSVIESAAGFTLDSSTGNSIGNDAGLAGLGCNGSKQRTHGLEPSSPAIDFVPAAACTLTTDQRGSPRPVDGDGDTVADCDAGALEDQGPGDFLSSYHTVVPCRLVDTRGAPGVDFGGPSLSFPSYVDRDYDIAGRCGIPGSASALALNATVTNATRGGSIALYDPEVPGWMTPFLYFGAGRTRAKNGIIPFCTDVGVVRAHVQFDYQGDYYGSVDFILDIVGYFE